MSQGVWASMAAALMITAAIVASDDQFQMTPLVSGVRPSPDDPLRVRQLQQRGARVFVDNYGRVVRVVWNHAAVVDEDLKLLHGLSELQSVSCRAAGMHGPGITDAGLKHLTAIPGLRWLNLSHNFRITNAGMRSLGQLRQLESLNLLWAGITNDSLQELQPLTRLRQLTLPFVTWKLVNGQRVTTETGCTPEGLPVLWGLPLEELDGISVYEDHVRFLKGFAHLRRWRGMSSHYQDADLADLPPQMELQRLVISLTDGWSDSSRLRELVRFPQLHSVKIAGAPGEPPVDGSGLQALGDLPHLTTLQLTNLNDDGLLKLPRLHSLKELALTGTPLGGAGLTGLTRFPKLTTLTLDRVALRDAVLRQFPELPALEELRLVITDSPPARGDSSPDTQTETASWSDAALEQALSRIPRLKRLSLAGLPVSNASLACLRLVPRLQTLDLSRTQVTDEGLSRLQLVPGLQELTLRQIRITDLAFDKLSSLKNLRALHHSSTAISFQGAADFHRQHPECYIEDIWNPDLESFGSYPRHR